MLAQEQFVRNFCVMSDGEVDFFLGAGASVSSGIPTGGDLVWEFKRTLYCTEHGISTEKFKDLALPSTRNRFQEYFDQQKSFPKCYSPNEYSFYFERCYSDPLARKRFIESIVSGREPSLGYLCMGEAMHRGKIKNVWTTNFDSLLENALNIMYPTNDVLVCSEANRNNVRIFNPTHPVIGKLHGDYRYDWLKNTEDELQELENEIKTYAASQLVGKQLVVIGYSGNDESIMSFLEENICVDGFLSKGLFWAIRKGSSPSERISKLIDQMLRNGKTAELVEIDSFENFMFSIYQTLNYSNYLIDRRKMGIAAKTRVSFSGNSVDSFIKLNAYVAEGYPLCNVFETDIKSWKELRRIIDGSDIIAGLFSQHIYSFSSAEKIKSAFKEHVLSEIVMEEVPDRIIQKTDSIYIGMIYQLIDRKLCSIGMLSYRKNKYYNPNSMQMKQDVRVYDAIEVAISYIDGIVYLNLLPTVHVLAKDGKRLNDDTYQLQVNKNTSVLYNRQYSEKLHFWEKLLLSSGKFTFSNDGFNISFATPAISCGGRQRNMKWPTLPAYMYSEPIMCYSDTDQAKVAINQLKGLNRFGPIDFSYMPKGTTRSSIKLAVLAPKQDMEKILEHLNSLNAVQDNKGKDAFLPHYEGFERIYRRSLTVPSKQDKKICIGYDGKSMAAQSPDCFLDFLKRGINYFSQNMFEFDVLVIYIPRYFSHFRTASSISNDFNLHDAIKLYATEQGITVQIIEEKSINTNEPCRAPIRLCTARSYL